MKGQDNAPEFAPSRHSALRAEVKAVRMERRAWALRVDREAFLAYCEALNKRIVR